MTGSGTDRSDQDRPNVIPWPPLIYLAAGIAAFAIDRFVPLWPWPPQSALELAGWGLAALGIVVAIAGVVTFKRIGTVVEPTGRAVRLATSGVYRLTRNPMYFGAILVFIGLAFALRSGGLLLVTPVVVIALHYMAIIREEAYLLRRFGAEYAEYQQRVRRWL